VIPYGLEFYVGVPGCGKSFLALRRAAALGKPVIALDCRSMLPPECAPEVHTLPAALRRVFDLGESVRFRPRTVPELDGAFAAARKVGKRFPVTIIFDEPFVFLSANYCPPVMEDCCRTQRGLDLHIFLTTQQPQDIPARVRNCASAAFVFKCTDENSIKAVRSWAPDPARVAALSKENHEYIAWSV
jgi:hypothetical protein